MQGTAEVMYCDAEECKRFFTKRCNLTAGGQVISPDGEKLAAAEIPGFQCKCCQCDLCGHHCRVYDIHCSTPNMGNGHAHTKTTRFGPLCPSCLGALHKFVEDGQLERIVYLFLEKRLEKTIESEADLVTLLRQDLE